MRIKGVKPLANSAMRLKQVIPVSFVWLTEQNLGSLYNGEAATYSVAAATSDGSSATYAAGNPLPPGVVLNTATGVISGYPTTPGTYTFTIRVQAGIASASRTFTLVVNPLSVNFPEENPDLGAFNGGFKLLKQFDGTASNGGTLVWSISAGTLPAGLTLSPTGALRGTISNYDYDGSFTVRATVTGTSVFAEKTVSMKVLAAALAYEVDGALGTIPAGTAYSVTLNARSRTTDPVRYAVVAGQLPLGLSLDTVTGTLAGTPLNIGGTSNFTIRASNGVVTLDLPVSVTVDQDVITWGSASLLTLIGNRELVLPLNAVSDNGEAVSVTIISGTLPAGLTLINGVISGTVPNVNLQSAVILRASDRVTFSDRTLGFSITKNVVTFQNTPNGFAVTQGEALNASLLAVSSVNNALTYTIVGGALPAGITLTGNTLSGTSNVPGSYTITVRASDGSVYADYPITIIVNAIPVWYTAAGSLSAPLDSGTDFSYALNAQDPDGQIASYTLISGSLPSLLSLSRSGTIQGSVGYPSVANPPVWTTPAGSLGQRLESQTFTQTLTATPFSGRTVRYSVADGAFPAGLRLTPASGLLTGTLASDNDTQGTEATARITPLPDWTANTALGATFEGNAVSYTLSGTGLTNYAIVGGVAPWGLSLNATTGVLSGTVADLTPVTDPSQFTQVPAWITAAGPIGSTSDAVASSFTVRAQPTSGNVKYALLDGTIPSGMVLSSAGVLSGTAAVDVFLGDNPEGALSPKPYWNSNAVMRAVSEGDAVGLTMNATPLLGTTLSYAMVSGYLPWGLTLTASGALSGTVQDNSPWYLDPALVPNAPVWASNATLTAAKESLPYSLGLSATPAAGRTITAYEQVGGILPAGLTLTRTGALSGTVSGDGFVGSNNDPVEVSPGPAPSWTGNAALGAVNEGATLSASVAATANFGTVVTSYALVAGALPWGLTLSGSTVSGTVQDTSPWYVDPAAVPTPPVWVSNAVQGPIKEGDTFSLNLQANLATGRSVSHFAQISGILPSGLTLTRSGTLSGTVAGFNFVGPDNDPVEISLTPVPTWNTNQNLGAFPEGNAVTVALSATPNLGTNPTYALVAGTLPWGLSISGAQVSGTLQDNSPWYVDPALVPNPPVWTTPAGSLGSFSVGNAVTITLQATAVPPRSGVKYNLDGLIPLGTVFNTSTGQISGTVDQDSATRTFNFSVRAIDTAGAYTDQSFSISIQ